MVGALGIQLSGVRRRTHKVHARTNEGSTVRSTEVRISLVGPKGRNPTRAAGGSRDGSVVSLEVPVGCGERVQTNFEDFRVVNPPRRMCAETHNADTYFI